MVTARIWSRPAVLQSLRDDRQLATDRLHGPYAIAIDELFQVKRVVQ
jgi:hypothetical protein